MVANYPFIGFTEVEERRSGVPFSIVDARSERHYRSGHLPAAVNVPARSLNPPVEGVRHLISGRDLERRLTDLGIGAEPTVVYGSRGGADAAHVWWTLQAYGHPAVTLLDGGVEVWQAAGLPLTQEAAEPARTTLPFTATLNPFSQIDREELIQRLDNPDLSLLDTRTDTEFSGQDFATARGGHLPGALLRPWDDTLETDWRLKSEAELRSFFAPLFATPEVAIYCQSGVRAAHSYAVLEALGHPGPRLYLRSWAEWGNLDHLPIATDRPKEVPT